MVNVFCGNRPSWLNFKVKLLMLHGVFGLLCAIAMKRDGIGNRLKLRQTASFSLAPRASLLPICRPLRYTSRQTYILSFAVFAEIRYEVAVRYILHLAFTAVYQHNRVSLLCPNGMREIPSASPLRCCGCWIRTEVSSSYTACPPLSQGPPHKPMVFFLANEWAGRLYAQCPCSGV